MNSLAKATVAITVIVGAPWLYTLYKRYPVESFCRNLSAGTTREQVASTASVAGLWINPINHGTESVHVFNQRAPFFRFACVVQFKDDKVVSTNLISAD